MEENSVQENLLNPKTVILGFVVLMALGLAGFGPRVRAHVDQAGGLKDAPARILHPYTEETLATETTISKSLAF